jgi:prepilin-type N-terminal cleavage/methylation domain-containing protein
MHCRPPLPAGQIPPALRQHGAFNVIDNKHGFTLVELIFSLVLLGIIGVFGTLFIVESLEGYILARSNVEKTQKAQSALVRLTMELENLTGLSSYSQGGSSITYTTRPKSTEPDIARSISLVNGRVRIIDGATSPAQNTGSTLVDGVGDFQLRYYEISESGVLTNWGGSLEDLYAIEIQLVLNAEGSYGAPVTFSTTVSPRRNGHWDGASQWNR